MPNEFILSRNARFYTADQVSEQDIAEIIEAATKNAVEVLDQHSVFRQEVAALNFRYSTALFLVERDLHFHSDPLLKDRVYGYIVIIEIDNHLVITKKNCSDLNDQLDDKFEKISYEALAAAVDTDTAEFRKINARNMTVSERAVRNKSYEAMNLNGVMSLHAAGRSIPSYLRVQDGSSTKSVTLTAGRLVEISDRQSIEAVAAWARSELKRMTSTHKNDGFLKNFARSVDLAELETNPNPVIPRSLLIETSILTEKIESGSIKIFFETRAGTAFEIRGKARVSLLDVIGKVYEFDDNGAVIGHEDSAWLKGKPGRKSLTFHSKVLQRIKVSIEGVETMTLLKFIHKNGAYSICFDDTRYMYFAKRCFIDVSGSSEIDALLALFLAVPALKSATSEKGKFLPTQVDFDIDTVFSVVEQIHCNDDFLFCDDLGDEWADHISFSSKENCVFFVHSKHGEPSSSASSLQVVVGQAMKNLGNMYFSIDQIVAKYEKSIRGKKMTGSNIDRVRKRNGQFPSFLRKLVGNYKYERVCVLACSFVSKSQMSKEFKKIKSNQAVAGNITQFFWIVSSFAHACKEAGVTPRIYCQP
ncbi:hypothetical protein NG827_00690 [Xanthomonas sacchari]|uniref:hypothetical protein n=1 Tax=Xanthomonas TaxID=338 RepID=UPI0011E6E8BE|nr:MULTISPECIES: hypothetical protein [Xanthomonas]MDQ7761616.1 hypothetical protein [Xanthomonas sontii]UYK84978.1 hypothetical protein NG827_00690 [Xanthomonas sacchari]UZK05418.1 hypothetical protein CJ027_000745 [Xanthomonas sontii]